MLAVSEEEPPEYDVAERVRQLNEELAKEPSPTEHHPAIKFNDNPVSLVVPPPEYPSDEEADRTGSKTSQGQAQAQGDSMEVMKDDESVDSDRSATRDFESVDQIDSDVRGMKVDDNDDVIAEVVDSDNEQEKMREARESRGSASDDDDAHRVERESDSDENSDEKTDASKRDDVSTDKTSSVDDEKVLVERNGKFELVLASTLTAEEKELYLPDYNKKKTASTAAASDTHSNSSKSSSDSKLAGGGGGAKSRSHRPATATANQSRGRAATSSTPSRRVQSAQVRQTDYTTYEDYGYKSPYGLTEKEKEQLKREQKKKEEKKKKKEEDEKARKLREQEEANDCFQVQTAMSTQSHLQIEQHKTCVASFVPVFLYSCTCIAFYTWGGGYNATVKLQRR